MKFFKRLRTGLLMALVLVVLAGSAMAEGRGPGNGPGNGPGPGNSGSSVPEIDPSSIGSALALLGFGATMLIDRRRK